jgi:hypothetical protein
MKLLIIGVFYLLQFISAQRNCGTIAPKHNRLSNKSLLDPDLKRFIRPFKNAIIEVYFHVIQDSNNQGKIPTQTILKQMKLLNTAYASTGIKFELLKIDAVISDRWFGLDFVSYDKHYEMKNALRQGGPDALNIYTTKLSNLGYSTFPHDANVNLNFDGVVVEFTSLPGGSYKNYNLGMTVVHEVGHWCGLQHTFKGNDCEGEGDGVDDTPAQKSPTVGCPMSKRPDTCTLKPGIDMINNYMDYSPDSCINAFTLGQIKLMTASLRLYRGITDSDRVLKNDIVGTLVVEKDIKSVGLSNRVFTTFEAILLSLIFW